MATFTRISTLLLVSFALAGPAASAFVFEGNAWPVVVVPDSDTVEPGGGTGITITMNETSTTHTVVALSSSHPTLLQVPSTTSVPAGYLTKSFGVVAPWEGRLKARTRAKTSSTVVRVTATANGHSAYTDITVTE